MFWKLKAGCYDNISMFLSQCEVLALLQEWGDPQKEEFYFYMKSYSAVDNVSANVSCFSLTDINPSDRSSNENVEVNY